MALGKLGLGQAEPVQRSSPGLSMRRTSAPHAASVRVAAGPAMTLVRSSTRTPEAPRPVPSRRA